MSGRSATQHRPRIVSRSSVVLAEKEACAVGCRILSSACEQPSRRVWTNSCLSRTHWKSDNGALAFAQIPVGAVLRIVFRNRGANGAAVPPRAARLRDHGREILHRRCVVECVLIIAPWNMRCARWVAVHPRARLVSGPHGPPVPRPVALVSSRAHARLCSRRVTAWPVTRRWRMRRCRATWRRVRLSVLLPFGPSGQDAR